LEKRGEVAYQLELSL
jgi:hypothetical protein